MEALDLATAAIKRMPAGRRPLYELLGGSCPTKNQPTSLH